MALDGEVTLRLASMERKEQWDGVPPTFKNELGSFSVAQGNAMNCTKQDKGEPDSDKVPVSNDQEQLRRQLLEMIRRNEERRRLKTK